MLGNLGLFISALSVFSLLLVYSLSPIAFTSSSFHILHSSLLVSSRVSNGHTCSCRFSYYSLDRAMGAGFVGHRGLFDARRCGFSDRCRQCLSGGGARRLGAGAVGTVSTRYAVHADDGRVVCLCGITTGEKII